MGCLSSMQRLELLFLLKLAILKLFMLELLELLLTGSKMTGFNQMISFLIFAEFPHVIPMERQETFGFLLFSGVIKFENWTKVAQCV